MPHQCVHCGKLHEDSSRAILDGCGCGSHFFFFVKQNQLENLNNKIIELEDVEKKRVEKDVRGMIGLEDEQMPVILDLESIRILGPGKFEIDVVNLFSKQRPLIYKLEEGKYIIDLASTLNQSLKNSKDNLKL